ncbi:VOC family protein [Chloroflexota bacterium]
MAKPVRHRLAHICILVKDIDQAIEHFTNILSVTAPELLEQQIVKEERESGGDKYIQVFFPALGDACDIQLMQPLNPESRLYKYLERHGEGPHHICFSSSDLEDTYKSLNEKGVPLFGQQPKLVDRRLIGSSMMWISPKYAHGLLIEVMRSYKAVDGHLVIGVDRD